MREMAHRATHDALTGLPNRVLLDDRIDGSLVRARRVGQVVAVAFVDVDRFKAINDSFGHGGGDAVLREVAPAPSERGAGIRHGGPDRWRRVRPGRGSTDERGRALRRWSDWWRCWRRRSRSAGTSCASPSSIGVSVFPRDGASREELLRHADMAMYRAKQTGRDRIVFYAEDMNSEARDRLWLERELRAALERRRLLPPFSAALCARPAAIGRVRVPGTLATRRARCDLAIALRSAGRGNWADLPARPTDRRAGSGSSGGMVPPAA